MRGVEPKTLTRIQRHSVWEQGLVESDTWSFSSRQGGLGAFWLRSLPLAVGARGLVDNLLQCLQKALKTAVWGSWRGGKGLLAASGLKTMPLGVGAFEEPGQKTPCVTFN
jgi:hypothetical protein